MRHRGNHARYASAHDRHLVADRRECDTRWESAAGCGWQHAAWLTGECHRHTHHQHLRGRARGTRSRYRWARCSYCQRLMLECARHRRTRRHYASRRTGHDDISGRSAERGHVAQRPANGSRRSEWSVSGNGRWSERSVSRGQRPKRSFGRSSRRAGSWRSSTVRRAGSLGGDAGLGERGGGHRRRFAGCGHARK